MGGDGVGKSDLGPELVGVFVRAVLTVCGGAFVFAVGYGIWSLNQPVLPCKELVAMSSTCIPFGCSKTYINERGEDTGECR